MINIKEKSANRIAISIEDKVVSLKGHDEIEYFQIFTESLETHPELSSQEKEEIRKYVGGIPSIIID